MCRYVELHVPPEKGFLIKVITAMILIFCILETSAARRLQLQGVLQHKVSDSEKNRHQILKVTNEEFYESFT
jgi:hypothetical protein